MYDVVFEHNSIAIEDYLSVKVGLLDIRDEESTVIKDFDEFYNSNSEIAIMDGDDLLIITGIPKYQLVLQDIINWNSVESFDNEIDAENFIKNLKKITYEEAMEEEIWPHPEDLE